MKESSNERQYGFTYSHGANVEMEASIFSIGGNCPYSFTCLHSLALHLSASSWKYKNRFQIEGFLKKIKKYVGRIMSSFLLNYNVFWYPAKFIVV